MCGQYTYYYIQNKYFSFRYYIIKKKSFLIVRKFRVLINFFFGGVVSGVDGMCTTSEESLNTPMTVGTAAAAAAAGTEATDDVTSAADSS